MKSKVKNFHCSFRKSFNRFDYVNVKLNINKSVPPRKLRILKGSLHVLLRRDFAQFAVTSKLALELYNWLQDMSIPDESFFSTLSSIRIGANNAVTQEIPKTVGIKNGEDVSTIYIALSILHYLALYCT